MPRGSMRIETARASAQAAHGAQTSPDLIRLDMQDARAVCAWDAFVDAHPMGAVFHRTQWGAAVSEACGFQCHYLYARKKSAHGTARETPAAIAGIFPLVHCRSRLFGDSLISVCFGTGGGLLANDTATRNVLLRAAQGLAGRLGVPCVENRGGAAGIDGWTEKRGVYAGFRKRLAEDKEICFARLRPARRGEIRKALGAGVNVSHDGTLRDFYPLRCAAMRRLGTPVHARRWYGALLDRFGDMAQISLAHHRGKAVAAVLGFHYKGETLPYYFGACAEARPLAAATLLYWRLMAQGITRKCPLFNFGRSRVGSGAWRYKRLWGFEPENLTYSYWLSQGAPAPEVNPDSPEWRWKVALWKRMPLWAANRLGPRIARQIG